jgi:hypothetical protein
VSESPDWALCVRFTTLAPWDEPAQGRIRVETQSRACAGDRLKDCRRTKTTQRTTAVRKERLFLNQIANVPVPPIADFVVAYETPGDAWARLCAVV